jgi:phosphatidylinositol alpha-mannosyltransferase
MFASTGAGAPVVGTFHSGVGTSVLYDAISPALRLALRRIRDRIAVSAAAARTARRRLGGNYELIPNGIDLARWSSAEPRDLGPGTKLLFVGRLDERKGFAVAVDAFERLARDRDDLRLIVAGEGPAAARVRRLPPDIEARVRLLGSVPNQDLASIAAACDVYVGPASGGESFGVVLIEAMAAGLPVVVSDIPGYDEVASDGVDSLLVPPNDAVSLEAAVARVLDDPGLARKLSEGGRERARGFDWDPIVDRIEAVYERAAGRMRP